MVADFQYRHNPVLLFFYLDNFFVYRIERYIAREKLLKLQKRRETVEQPKAGVSSRINS